MCRRCSIICKIILCVVLSLIALVFIAFGYLSILRGEMLAERKSRLVNIIDKTEAIFQRYDL